MSGFKILLVEDNPKSIEDAINDTLFAEYFKEEKRDRKISSSFDEANSSRPKDNKNAENPLLEDDEPPDNSDAQQNTLIDQWKETIPFLEVATDVTAALQLLKYHAEDYLLLIVDRDLGVVDNDKIKEIWTDFNDTQQVTYAGDILLEYLCLEKGMVKECKERFYFLTANAGEAQTLKNFLKAMHFSKEKIKELIVEKDKLDGEAAKKLKSKINDPVCFHLQHKHKEVFRALIKNSEDLCIDKSEHVENMIKALAYVEGVSLYGGKKPEPPSVGLLRQLLEAFRQTIKQVACEKEYFALPWEVAKEFDEKKKGFDVNTLNISRLFDPYCTEKNGDLFEFQQKHEHYAHIDQLIFSITSQEIHHNDRLRFEGYRVHLVVYGICELLRFYAAIKLKGDPISFSPDKVKKSRVLDLIRCLDKDEKGWMNCKILSHFKDDLIQECKNANLEFIQKDDDKSKFKLKEE